MFKTKGKQQCKTQVTARPRRQPELNRPTLCAVSKPLATSREELLRLIQTWHTAAHNWLICALVQMVAAAVVLGFPSPVLQPVAKEGEKRQKVVWFF